VPPEDVVFTGGATEAINLALERLPERLISSLGIRSSPIEHRAVTNSLQRLQRRGARIEMLRSGRGGVVDPAQINTAAVYVVQAANSETGVIQDIAAISEAVHNFGGLLICDAAQALWKMPLEDIAQHADALILSAHKAYGPKGVGVLVATDDFRRVLRRDFPEKAQEAHLREGTVSVASAVGFAKVAELVATEGDAWRAATRAARDAFETFLDVHSAGRASANWRDLSRLPNTSSVWIPGQPGDLVVIGSRNIAISYGSACSSGAPEPSPVLIASGLARTQAHETVRVSFGRDHTVAEGEFAALEITRL